MTTGTRYRDLAVVLIEGRPGAIAHVDLGALIAFGAEHDVPPEAIVIARERLQGAADRGSENAADVLRQLTAMEAAA